MTVNRDSALRLTPEDTARVVELLGLDPAKVSAPIYVVGETYRVELRVPAFPLHLDREPRERNLNAVTVVPWVPARIRKLAS